MSQANQKTIYIGFTDIDKYTAVKWQGGVSLVEVLTAIFILTFGALAIANLQSTSAIAVRSSADHFKINELSQIIVEQLKADSANAAAGDYNTDYTETEAPDTATPEIAAKINNWKNTMARSTPRGETKIDCDDDSCTVSLRWYENSHDGETDQVFNLKTPI